MAELLIILVSYFFYGWWDWRFLSLIIFSSTVDYFIGLELGKSNKQGKRKKLLWTSIAINIGLLGFFKYYNFFITEFINAFDQFGINLQASTLKVILPVGISFYTFQTLSYTIDVYRRKLEPVGDWKIFFAYVSFFPQLVAGPIERATNLIPQFSKTRIFNYEKAKDGMRQILWGLFKKMVIADSCGILVDDIFTNYASYGSITLALGAILFAFQIYCDFSGYSDIAIGTARLFGVDLMRNFAYPYFSRNIGEFWRRWHISLSTWFRDYLYIPLGGSRVDRKWKLIRNVFIIFVVSGFWHGANWTFIAWGALNALYFLPSILNGSNRMYLNTVASKRNLPSLKEFGSILVTFGLVCFSWIFFRVENLSHGFNYILQMITNTSLDLKILREAAPILAGIVILILIEWFKRTELHPFQFNNPRVKPVFRMSIYMLTALSILLFSPKKRINLYLLPILTCEGWSYF